jgi:hypothetical protein
VVPILLRPVYEWRLEDYNDEIYVEVGLHERYSILASSYNECKRCARRKDKLSLAEFEPKAFMHLSNLSNLQHWNKEENFEMNFARGRD